MRHAQNKGGFTLVEVLIAIMILTFLTVYIAKAIQNGTTVKKKLQGDIDSYSQVRDAIKIIEHDIQLAFHQRDLTYEVKLEMINDAKKKQLTAAPGSPPVTAPVQMKEGEKPHTTDFLGDSNKLDFVSQTNTRLSAERPESNLLVVGYFLKTCKTLGSTETSQCLWRRTSPIIEDDITKGGKNTMLLSNIKEFTLRYLGKGKTEWSKQWFTNERGDDATRGVFPIAVEITLKAEMNKKEVAMTSVTPIRLPNNKEKEAEAGEGELSQKR